MYLLLIAPTLIITNKVTKMVKIAPNSTEAWDLQEVYEGQPHGWIQWKGTDVCMDIYCKCGQSFHIDSTFAYSVQCPKCDTCYHCNGHIELIELRQVPDNTIRGEDHDNN